MQTAQTYRSMLIGNFADGSGYVFNAEYPSGVKYLPKASYNRYVELVSLYGNPPLLPKSSTYDPFIEQIVAHGLFGSEGEVHRPAKPKPKALTIWFHVSNACNLSCSYCYIPKLQKAKSPSQAAGFFMPSETATLATQRLFEFCQSEGFTHLQIKFAGGEPTLNPELLQEVCLQAKALSEATGVKVGFRILTNGVFTDERVIDIFRSFKFGVSISLDGNRDSHDKVRFALASVTFGSLKQQTVREGTWSIVLENIDKLIRIGIKPYILCTITRDNYSTLRELVELCISKSIGFRLSPVRDETSHAIPGVQDAILEELKSIYSWLGESLPVSMPLERFARFAEWNLTVRKQMVCGSCRSTMSVDHQGNVASCQMRMDKTFGNLKDLSVKTIFDNIKTSDFNSYIVSPHTKTGECISCSWRYTCAGGCPEHTRNALGTLNSPSPWCDLYMNLLPVYVRAVANQIKRAIETRVSTLAVNLDGSDVVHAH